MGGSLPQAHPWSSQDMEQGHPLWHMAGQHQARRRQGQQTACTLQPAPVPKSPEKPGMRWMLASVTHTWPGVAEGVSWAVVHRDPPHPQPRYPFAGSPGSAETWGEGTAGKGNTLHRGSRQELGAARREAPCIPAPSSCRPPRKCSLLSRGPQQVTTCILGSLKGCARVSMSLSCTGQLG